MRSLGNMVILDFFFAYLALLLGHYKEQQPKINWYVIFLIVATNTETTFLKFQKKFFLTYPSGHAFRRRFMKR